MVFGAMKRYLPGATRNCPRGIEDALMKGIGADLGQPLRRCCPAAMGGKPLI